MSRAPRRFVSRPPYTAPPSAPEPPTARRLARSPATSSPVSWSTATGCASQREGVPGSRVNAHRDESTPVQRLRGLRRRRSCRRSAARPTRPRLPAIPWRCLLNAFAFATERAQRRGDTRTPRGRRGEKTPRRAEPLGALSEAPAPAVCVSVSVSVSRKDAPREESATAARAASGQSRVAARTAIAQRDRGGERRRAGAREKRRASGATMPACDALFFFSFVADLGLSRHPLGLLRVTLCVLCVLGVRARHAHDPYQLRRGEHAVAPGAHAHARRAHGFFGPALPRLGLVTRASVPRARAWFFPVPPEVCRRDGCDEREPLVLDEASRESGSYVVQDVARARRRSRERSATSSPGFRDCPADLTPTGDPTGPRDTGPRAYLRADRPATTRRFFLDARLH